MKIGSNSFGSFVEFLKWSNRDKIAAFAFLLFFCSDVLDSVLFRIIPNFTDNIWDVIRPIENILLLLPIYYSCLTLKNKYNVWRHYLMIFVLISLTLLIYPEYSDWFLHSDFGIENRFLVLTRGIYALLIISLFNSGEKIFHCLIYASKINFLFYSMQYFMAGIRGYWQGVSAEGQAIELQYNLLFGYNVVFCLIVFIAAYIYTKKKIYFFLVPMCLYTLMTGGSRGALSCLVAFIPIYFIVKWRDFFVNYKNVIKSLLIFMCLSISLFFYWRDALLILRDLGISSRTIDMLLSGNIFDANGRDIIYNMAIQMIKDGDLFGYGVYGDRYVIGREFYWGYAHNFFLEIFVCFGYFGGICLVSYLVYRIYEMIKYCKNDAWQMVLVVFLAACAKLLLSDSFWYYKPFWGLIGVLGVWRHMWRCNIVK